MASNYTGRQKVMWLDSSAGNAICVTEHLQTYRTKNLLSIQITVKCPSQQPVSVSLTQDSIKALQKGFFF